MTNSNINIIYLILPVFFIIGIFILNSNGIVSYLWTLLLFLVINCFIDKNWKFRNFVVIHVFVAAALIVYTINLSQFPLQQGLTGGEGVITDDSAYFASAADVLFQGVHGHGVTKETPYVILMRFLYPFKIVDPINLIILNILLGLAFLPYLTAKISERLFHDQNICRSAFWLIAFCPFCWSGGLIIMRDVPSLIFILWAFLLFLNRKYFHMTIPLALLIWIKFGFIVFLIVPIVCYIYIQTGPHLTSKKIWFIVGVLVVLVLVYVVIIPNLFVVTGGKMDDGNLFRDNFLDFLAENNDQSLLIKIYQMPVVIRIPLLIAAFITMPMLTIPTGLIHPRGILSLFYTVYIMFLCGYAFRLLFPNRELDQNAKTLLWTIPCLALALGMVSLQFRHKVILMPFIYMAVAYGMNRLHKSRKAQIVQIGYIGSNIIYAVYKLGI